MNPAFFTNVIEIPQGCTSETSRSGSQQYLDKTLLHGLIASVTAETESGQSCYFSAAHPQEAKRCSVKLASHSEFFALTTSDIPTEVMKLIWSKYKRCKSEILSNIHSCCCSLRRHPSRMHRKNRRIRSNPLDWKTRSHTEHSSNPSRFPCIGWPIT